ncbi:MAG: hypothetical protein LBL83_10055 [Clostridiales bacterium]|jgi:N-acetylglucosamine kinase-like BadF-type ATPase|nr:hypothetical protein [Clostridiales bacterium]
MKRFLAVDQGGSKTEALVFSENGEILAFADDRDARAPGESYRSSQGRWIRCATERALEKAGLALGDLSGACCALNGADWPADYIRLRGLVSGEISLAERQIRIVNDCIGAMRGGADRGDRAVLCLGTGMNCAVRSAAGDEYIFGYFVAPADQGGSALGSRAWGCVLDACNGLGEKTALTELVLQKYGKSGKSDFAELYSEITAGALGFKVYDLCPLLMRAAKARDGVAAHILRTSGERMIRYVEEGAKKLGLAGAPIALVLAGGVFKGDGAVFFETLERIAAERELNIVCVRPRCEPVAGAALLLLDELAGPERAEALSRFDSCAARFGLKQA